MFNQQLSAVFGWIVHHFKDCLRGNLYVEASKKSYFYCLKSYFETCRIRNALLFEAELKTIVVRACSPIIPCQNFKRVFRRTFSFH